MPKDLIRIDVGGGTYTVVQPEDGVSYVLRNGEPWLGKDNAGFPGLNCVLAMAYELDALRKFKADALIFIEASAKQFRHYQGQHEGKSQDTKRSEGERYIARVKAEVNRNIASELEGFLARGTRPSVLANAARVIRSLMRDLRISDSLVTPHGGKTISARRLADELDPPTTPENT